METFQYDQVYHEHIYYYTITPLIQLFKEEGLEIVTISEKDIHGGSVRVIIRKKRDDDLAPMALMYQHRESFINSHHYENFGQKVRDHIRDSKKLLLDLKKSGLKIAGFGAAAKGCVFLNSCGFDYNTIDYVIDDTDTKQGLFIPGTGIEIVSREILKTNPPDYILILAHNFSDYIKSSLKDVYNGKYIVMFPYPTIHSPIQSWLISEI